MSLVRLGPPDKAAQALARAETLKDVKDFHDLAEAARVYAKLHEDQNYAAEWKLRAARKGGEMLAVIERSDGGRPAEENPSQAEKGFLASIGQAGLEKNTAYRWQHVADLDPSSFEAYIEQNWEDGGEITLAGALRLLALTRRAEVGSLAPPDGTYRAIVVDPPWPEAKIIREVRPKQARFAYSTMRPDELRGWGHDVLAPVAAEDGCHLYLWTTHKYLPLALGLVKDWGFAYQCILTWIKSVGMTPFSWMYSTEHVVFARRGSLDLAVMGKRLDFRADVREHSRKPDEFYDLVRTVSPGPRIDMFSRETREGFDSWGSESGYFD